MSKAALLKDPSIKDDRWRVLIGSTLISSFMAMGFWYNIGWLMIVATIWIWICFGMGLITIPAVIVVTKDKKVSAPVKIKTRLPSWVSAITGVYGTTVIWLATGNWVLTLALLFAHAVFGINLQIMLERADRYYTRKIKEVDKLSNLFTKVIKDLDNYPYTRGNFSEPTDKWYWDVDKDDPKNKKDD